MSRLNVLNKPTNTIKIICTRQKTNTIQMYRLTPASVLSLRHLVREEKPKKPTTSRDYGHNLFPHQKQAMRRANHTGGPTSMMEIIYKPQTMDTESNRI